MEARFRWLKKQWENGEREKIQGLCCIGKKGDQDPENAFVIRCKKNLQQGSRNRNLVWRVLGSSRRAEAKAVKRDTNFHLTILPKLKKRLNTDVSIVVPPKLLPPTITLRVAYDIAGKHACLSCSKETSS